MFPAWKLPPYEVVVLHSGIVCFIAAQFYILLCLCRESVTRFSVMWLANKKYCKNSLSLDINSHKTMKSGAWGKLTWYLGISHGRGGGGVLWSWLGIPVPLLPPLHRYMGQMHLMDCTEAGGPSVGHHQDAPPTTGTCMQPRVLPRRTEVLHFAAASQRAKGRQAKVILRMFVTYCSVTP